MFRKCAPIAFAVAMLLFSGTALVAAADYDLDDGAITIPDNTNGDSVYLYSSGGLVQTTQVTNDVTLTGGTLTVGKSSGDAGYGFRFTMGQVIGEGGSFKVVQAANNLNRNVTLNLGGLSLNAGGSASFGDGTVNGTVTVTASTLAADGGAAASLTVETNSTVTFTSVSNDTLGRVDGSGSNVDVNLAGGSLGFANAVTLGKGTLTVSRSSTLAVGGTGFTVSGRTPADAQLVITGSNNLTVLKDLNDPNTLGNLTIGGNGATAAGGTLSMMDPNATLTVGKLVFGAGAQFVANAAGKITADGLDVNGNFNDAANVQTTVSGLTTIKRGATYYVNGSDANANVYRGGMLVQGVLHGGSDGNLAAVELGASMDDLRDIRVDGGSIAAGTGRFDVNYADIKIISATAPSGAVPATLDASGGRLNLEKSDVTVQLNSSTAATIYADEGIVANSYRQLAGRVDISTGGASGKMVVNETAVIGSSDASNQVQFDVSGNSVQFASGLTLDKYGAVTATRTGGVVNVGSLGADDSANIVANGNNQLYAADGLILGFNDLSRDQTGRMTWNGIGNTAYGFIDQSGFAVSVRPAAELTVATGTADYGYNVGSMTVYGRLRMGTNKYPGAAGTGVSGIVQSNGNVSVKSGGSIVADYATARIINTGSEANVFKVDEGGTLRANTATVRVEDFKSADINGTFVAGLLDSTAAPTTAARLVANSDINISSTALITMTTELAKTVTSSATADNATKLIQVENSPGSTYKINNKANMSSKSMLGLFEYALNSDSTVLYVQKAAGQISLDGSESDRLQAWENLRDIWGEKQVNKDLSDIIYDVVNGDIAAEPEDSIAGNKNLNLLEAIASPEGKVVGRDTLEYLNGGHLYGITDVAIETSRTFMSDVTNRAKALGCSFVAAREASSSDAWASTAMNSVLNNRFWLGGSGMWQDAKEKDGFSGYKYHSYGFVGGYDRVAAENVAVGASFAYNKGKYEDKGAFGSDSDIESFSVGLYGTYSNPCGWFLTGHGAYTYSQNDIRELRRDPDAERLSWGQSNFHTGTWSFGALFGYDVRLPGEGLVITPSVGANYIHAGNSDHESFLDGVATQRVKGAKNSAFFVPVDLTLQYDACIGIEGKLRVEANAGYSYNFKKDGMSGTITYVDLHPESVISIHGRGDSQHTYKFGGGARYSYRTFDVGLRYDFIGRSDARTHRLMATAGTSF